MLRMQRTFEMISHNFDFIIICLRMVNNNNPKFNKGRSLYNQLESQSYSIEHLQHKIHWLYYYIKMIAKLYIVLSLLFLTFAQQPTPPHWGGFPQYQVNVNMTYDDPVMNWTFTYYYDAILKVERYEHKAPQADQMCLLADPPFGINDSCTVIHAVDGWAYILYKAHNWCCKCENTFHWVNYDWLQDAIYQGTDQVRNYTVQHWTKQGQSLNHYYNTAAGYPVRYFELKNNIPKAWDFDLSTFVKGPVDKTLFDPPCTNLCGGGCPSFRQSQTLRSE